MTLSLSRAGLALLVVASLSLRAAAQTDAAFASALGEAPAGLATLARLKKKAQKPAAPKAPTANDAVWQKVLEAVKTDGVYTPEAGRMPGTFSLEDVMGDPKANHTIQGITVGGLLNEEGQFQAIGAILIVSNFKLDPKDGNWRVEQWVFETDIYGQVANAGHGTAVQTPDGKVVSAAPDKLNPADPKIQAQYDAMLKHWAERKPEGA